MTHVVTADAVWRGLRSARGGNAFSATDIEEAFMSSADETKGRVKQAAGDLTGDKGLKREGKVDEMEGKAKKLVDDAGGKAKDAVHRDGDANYRR